MGIPIFMYLNTSENPDQRRIAMVLFHIQLQELI